MYTYYGGFGLLVLVLWLAFYFNKRSLNHTNVPFPTESLFRNAEDKKKYLLFLFLETVLGQPILVLAICLASFIALYFDVNSHGIRVSTVLLAVANCVLVVIGIRFFKLNPISFKEYTPKPATPELLQDIRFRYVSFSHKTFFPFILCFVAALLIFFLIVIDLTP